MENCGCLLSGKLEHYLSCFSDFKPHKIIEKSK